VGLKLPGGFELIKPAPRKKIKNIIQYRGGERMLTKKWKIERVKDYYIKDKRFKEGYVWMISDGIKTYTYPCEQYTKDQAWEAWERKIM
jgi:hypothetical protein